MTFLEPQTEQPETSRIATLRNLVKYGCVGIMNTLVSLAMFNLLLFVTGIVRGIPVALFVILSYSAGIINGFLWSKWWIFKRGGSGRSRDEFIRFCAVAIVMTLVSSEIVYLLTTFVAPPYAIGATIWANIAIILVFPISILGNFFGYKRFVFQK